MDSRHESTDFELYPLSPRVLFTPHNRSSSEPQQVHISTAGIDHIRVTWITDDQTTLSTVEYGTEPGNYAAKVSGDRSSYQFLTYRSGSIHHVRIGPLKPNTTYYYRCGGGGGGPEFSLKTPPSEFPVEFAVVGDLGQSEWTKSTLRGLDGKDYDVVLLPGDLSYADGRQPLWDSFGRLVEPQASRRPWMVTEGNHEMEGFEFDVDDQFMSYNARWLMPHKQNSGHGSDQYEWLVADLARTNRKKTPWLIVSMHMPWYNTNYEHQGDGESMRLVMEEILYNARADIVFAGHVHAYERFVRLLENIESY
ncbi:Purple acid phosphatase 22 [Linum perenne]